MYVKGEGEEKKKKKSCDIFGSKTSQTSGKLQLMPTELSNSQNYIKKKKKK